MKEKELIELLTSIIEANRTFYVGAASPVNEDGLVSLNGISAKVIGTSDTNDVIVKDSQTGAWYAFVRGYGQQVISSRNISLFQQHPRDKKIKSGFGLAVSADKTNGGIIFSAAVIYVGAITFDTSPAYGGDIADWLSTITSDPKDNVLLSDKTTKKQFVSIEDASLTTSISAGTNNWFGTGKLLIEQIDKANDSTLGLIRVELNFPSSPIARSLQRWSFSVDDRPNKRKVNDFGVEGLASNLAIGFEGRNSRKYGDFLSRFLQRVTTGGTNYEYPTDYPAREGDTGIDIDLDERTNAYLCGFAGFPACPLNAPINLPRRQFTYTYRWKEDTTTIYSFFQENVETTSYSLVNETVIAQKGRLYIEVSGTRYYGELVPYGDGERLAFVQSAQSPGDVDSLFYFQVGSSVPQNVNEVAVTESFFLPEFFAYTGEVGSSYLTWKGGSTGIALTGFIDPLFGEKNYRGITFLKEEEDEEGGVYIQGATVAVEYLPSDEWVYSEKVQIKRGGAVVTENLSPYPRITKESNFSTTVSQDAPSFSGTFLNGAGLLWGTDNFAPIVDVPLRGASENLYIDHYFAVGRFTDEIDDPLANYTRTPVPEPRLSTEFSVERTLLARRAFMYIIVDGIRRDYTSNPGSSVFFRFARSETFRNNAFDIEIEEDIFNQRKLKTSLPNGDAYRYTDANDFYANVYANFNANLFLDDGNVPTTFPISGFIDPLFGDKDGAQNDATLFRSAPDSTYTTAATIFLDFIPEVDWWYKETLTIKIDGVTVHGPEESIFSVDNGSTSLARRITRRGYSANLYLPDEIDYEIAPYFDNQQLKTKDVITAITRNLDRLNPNRNLFSQFYHLSPGATQSVSLAATTLSFSDRTLTIYGDGRVGIDGLVLCPFLAALDTSLFDGLDLSSYIGECGYISCQEGQILDKKTGILLECFRVRWGHAYKYVAGKADYNYFDDDHVSFEVIFVDGGIGDYDVIYRYFTPAYNDIEDLGAFRSLSWNPAHYDTGVKKDGVGYAAIASTENTGMYVPGSGVAGGFTDVTSRKIASEREGDLVFYVLNGEMRGYNEISLIDRGNTATPIRRIPLGFESFADLQIRLFFRIEEGTEGSRKIIVYMDEGTGAIISTSIPAIFSADTDGPNIYGQPGLTKKFKFMG